MEVLQEEEIKLVIEQYGLSKVLHWSIENYADELIGYLGDHLRLKVKAEAEGVEKDIKLFVKCMPRSDKWLSDYLQESSFFIKEFVMLSDLFKQFGGDEGSNIWRPKLLLVREDLFVFEDVTEIGYSMPCHRYTLEYDQILATAEAIAKFHARSYIYEEKKSKHLNRPYRIWEDYSDYLEEPLNGQRWRNAGRNAVIEYLKVYSIHKNKTNFSKCLEIVIPMLFEGALTLMKPSPDYRNVVIHRDLWTNNIFLKKLESGKTHALLVDFQTVLYSSPMLDLSSMIFFNTTRHFRCHHTSEILDFYYEILSQELKSESIDINTILDKTILKKMYEDSIMFGITQAAIIVPIVAMNSARRKQLFSDPETSQKINEVSRSEEFIETAKEDDNYRSRVTELFDEIVERFIYPQAVDQ